LHGIVRLEPYCQFFKRINKSKPKKTNFCQMGKIYLILLKYLIKNNKNYDWTM